MRMIDKFTKKKKTHCEIEKDNIYDHTQTYTPTCVSFKKNEKECIPVGCLPTAAVAATRCQYQGSLFGGGLCLEGISVWRGSPSGEGSLSGGKSL